MKKRWVSIFAIFFALCFSFLITSRVQAAYKRVSESSGIVSSGGYKFSYSNNGSSYVLKIAKGSSTKTIQVKTYSSLTNGKYVYYGTGSASSQTTTVYRYKLSNGSTTRIFSATVDRNGIGSNSIDLVGLTGSYLYYGDGAQYGGTVYDLRVYNLKKGTIRNTGISTASNVRVVNKKILVDATGTPHGGPLYLVKKSGSGKKQLGSYYYVERVRVTSKYIYYLQSSGYGTLEGRIVRCKLNGSGTKYLTGWGSMLKNGSNSIYSKINKYFG